MKKLLMLLLIIPMISFSQVSTWRTTTSQPAQSTQSRVQTSTPPQATNAAIATIAITFFIMCLIFIIIKYTT